MQFALSNTSMAGNLSGTLADVPMSVNLTLDTGGVKNSSSLTFDATTTAPLSMSSLLDELWPSRPAALSSFVSGLTFPALAVSYSRTGNYSIEASSGSAPAQPFLALADALSISAPAASYVDSPRAFSMTFTVDIPAMGINAARASLVSAGEQLNMQVCFG